MTTWCSCKHFFSFWFDDSNQWTVGIRHMNLVQRLIMLTSTHGLRSTVC